MPITFTTEKENGYFVSKYEGVLFDKDLIPPWREYLEKPDWDPTLNELCDLSQADLNGVTTQGIINFSKYSSFVYSSRAVEDVKVAVYAPHDLPFGLARMYESRSVESPEKLCIFRDLEEAKAWLKD